MRVDLAAFQAVGLDFLDDEGARYVQKIGRLLRGEFVFLRHQQPGLLISIPI